MTYKLPHPCSITCQQGCYLWHMHYEHNTHIYSSQNCGLTGPLQILCKDVLTTVCSSIMWHFTCTCDMTIKMQIAIKDDPVNLSWMSCCTFCVVLHIAGGLIIVTIFALVERQDFHLSTLMCILYFEPIHRLCQDLVMLTIMIIIITIQHTNYSVIVNEANICWYTLWM